MDNWKNYKFLKIFLQAEDYDVLMASKGSRSWHDWIGSLQAQKVQLPGHSRQTSGLSLLDMFATAKPQPSDALG